MVSARANQTAGGEVGPGRAWPWRGLVVGLALLPFNCLWVLFMESMTARGPFVSTVSLMFNVVFILFFLAVGNLVVRRVRPRLALTQAELIIVYVMLTIGTSVAGHDMFQVLMSIMATGTWYASQPDAPAQVLARTMTNTTPHWLVVANPDVLYGFYNGDSSFYRRAVIEAWARPLVWWTGFTVVLVSVMVCIAVLFRPLWANRERLTFPIIRLPYGLTQAGVPLLRQRVFWVGFLVAALVDLLNGLNYINPAVPSIPMYVDVGAYAQNSPWSAIGWLPFTFYPAIIGLGFLIPVDLVLSCTFFFFWWKLLYIISAVVGAETQAGPWSESVFPYTMDQVFGAVLAIAFTSVVGGRAYFKQVWYRIIGRPSEVSDRGEGVSFRVAFLGLVLGSVLLVAFSVRAGMSLGTAAVFFLLYYALAITIARVRAQLGSPVHDFTAVGPDRAITRVVGTANLGVRDLGMLTQYYWFNRSYRAHPIANSQEGIQMAAWAGTRPRPVIVAIVVATVVAMVAAPWWWLHIGYRLGVATHWTAMDWFGTEAYTRLQSWLEAPQEGSSVSMLAMGAGFATTLFLGLVRTRFPGFPLHPVALPIAASWSIHVYWAPMFIAGMVKFFILRYGGLRLYQRTVPLFYGFIVGGSIVSCSWPLLSAALGLPIYNAFAW